jgi:hypothetical protein
MQPLAALAKFAGEEAPLSLLCKFAQTISVVFDSCSTHVVKMHGERLVVGKGTIFKLCCIAVLLFAAAVQALLAQASHGRVRPPY